MVSKGKSSKGICSVRLEIPGGDWRGGGGKKSYYQDICHVVVTVTVFCGTHMVKSRNSCRYTVLMSSFLPQQGQCTRRKKFWTCEAWFKRNGKPGYEEAQTRPGEQVWRSGKKLRFDKQTYLYLWLLAKFAQTLEMELHILLWYMYLHVI